MSEKCPFCGSDRLSGSSEEYACFTKRFKNFQHLTRNADCYRNEIAHLRSLCDDLAEALERYSDRLLFMDGKNSVKELLARYEAMKKG